MTQIHENIEKIKEIVEDKLSCAAHNIDHIKRVYNVAMEIAKDERDIDLEVLQISVLLHDIARIDEDTDPTGNTDHALLGAKIAEEILKELNYSNEKIEHVKDCIISHRSRTDSKPETIEAKILFDADKIDTVGAVGTARSFMWIGKNNAQLYYKPKDLNKYIQENHSGKISGRIQDKSKHSVQIDFEIKVKHIENKLYTQKGKEICKERLKYHEEFLDRLEEEIKGEF